MVFRPQFGRLVRRAIAAGGGSPIEDEAPRKTDRDPLDHDGNGRKGGSLKGPRKPKGDKTS